MLRKRVITVLTFNDGVLFRTKMFIPDYRYTSNFVDAWSIDEIILLDITRPETRRPEIFISIVSEFSKKCFVPMCVGGGIRSIDDIKTYLDYGADKVSINTLALDKPDFITEAAKRFGSQCIVVSIDAKRVQNGYLVHKNCGREPTTWKPSDFARYVQDLGAGEIILTSIDKDGSLEGYDTELNESVIREVGIPVIICGGAGKWQDFADGITLSGADAVATTNVYHFTETSIKSAKHFLFNKGLNIRF